MYPAMLERATSNIKEIYICHRSNVVRVGRLWYQESPYINSQTYFRLCDATLPQGLHLHLFIREFHLGSIDVHNTF